MSGTLTRSSGSIQTMSLTTGTTGVGGKDKEVELWESRVRWQGTFPLLNKSNSFILAALLVLIKKKTFIPTFILSGFTEFLLLIGTELSPHYLYLNICVFVCRRWRSFFSQVLVFHMFNKLLDKSFEFIHNLDRAINSARIWKSWIWVSI